MYCRECGAPLSESDKFCVKCGRPAKTLEPPTEPLFKTNIKDIEAIRPEADPLEKVDLQKPGADMRWNTSYYPNSSGRPEPKKTPDIDFNWHIGAGEFRAQSTRELMAQEERYNEQKKAAAREAARRQIEEARAAEEAVRMESEKQEEQSRNAEGMTSAKDATEANAQEEVTAAETAADFTVEQKMTEADADLDKGEIPALEELIEEERPVEDAAWDTKVYNKGDAAEIARQEAEAQAEAMTEELMATMIFDDLDWEKSVGPTEASGVVPAEEEMTEEAVAAEREDTAFSQGTAATEAAQGMADREAASSGAGTEVSQSVADIEATEDAETGEMAILALPKEETKEKKHVGLFANLFSKSKTTPEEENFVPGESEEEKYITNAWEEIKSKAQEEEQALEEAPASEATFVTAKTSATEEAVSQEPTEEQAAAEETTTEETAMADAASEEPAVVDVWSALFNKTQKETTAQEIVAKESTDQELPTEKMDAATKAAPVAAAADDELRATFAEAVDLEDTPALDEPVGMTESIEEPMVDSEPTNAEGVAYEEGKQEPTPDSNTVTDWNNLFNRTHEEPKEVQEVVPGMPVINAPEEDSHIITVEDILSGKPLPDLSDEPAEQSFGFATPAPAWEGTSEEAPVQEEAITEAPAEPAAIDETPVEKAAIEEASVEPTAIEEASVEPTVIEATPVQEGAIAEAPATAAKGQSIQNFVEEGKELTSDELEKELFAEMADADANLSEAEKLRRRQTEKIDKFYTFNKKNEEFQELLDKEYEKFKASHANDDIGRDLNKFEDTDFYEDFTVRGASQAVEMAKARATFFGEELKMPTAEQYYPEDDSDPDDGFHSAGEEPYKEHQTVTEPPEDAEPIDPNKISDETQIWDMTLPIEEEANAVRDAFMGEMPQGDIFAEDDFLSDLSERTGAQEETLRALADSPEFGEMPNEEGVFSGAATAVTEAAPAASPGFFESRRIKREEKRAREDAAEMAENAAAEAKSDDFLSRLAADGFITEQPSDTASSFQAQGPSAQPSEKSASFFRSEEAQIKGASHGSFEWEKDSLLLEEGEEEKGGSRIGVVLLSLLSVLLVILVVFIVIRVAMPDSILSLKIDSFIDGLMTRLRGGAGCWPIHFYDLF